MARKKNPQGGEGNGCMGLVPDIFDVIHHFAIRNEYEIHPPPPLVLLRGDPPLRSPAYTALLLLCEVEPWDKVGVILPARLHLDKDDGTIYGIHHDEIDLIMMDAHITPEQTVSRDEQVTHRHVLSFAPNDVVLSHRGANNAGMPGEEQCSLVHPT